MGRNFLRQLVDCDTNVCPVHVLLTMFRCKRESTQALDQLKLHACVCMRLHVREAVLTLPSAEQNGCSMFGFTDLNRDVLYFISTGITVLFFYSAYSAQRGKEHHWQ